MLWCTCAALCWVAQLCLTLYNPVDGRPRLLCPWGFSRQESWSTLPCPPGDSPDPGSDPKSPVTPPPAGWSTATSTTWEAPLRACPVLCLVAQLLPTLSTPVTVTRRLLCPWGFSRQEYRSGGHALLQGIFWSRNWTGVSCIADGFFTSWAIREVQCYI